MTQVVFDEVSPVTPGLVRKLLRRLPKPSEQLAYQAAQEAAARVTRRAYVPRVADDGSYVTHDSEVYQRDKNGVVRRRGIAFRDAETGKVAIAVTRRLSGKAAVKAAKRARQRARVSA